MYNIIKSIQNAQGNIAKQAILNANAGNALLKAYLKATYDPAISYYMKKAPTAECQIEFAGLSPSLSIADIQMIVEDLGGRVHTGNAAIRWMRTNMETLNEEGQELLSLLISRSIGAGVGDTMVLKAFPDLFFIPPYQRCSLLDAKTKAKFAAMPSFYVQTKCDGSFAYLVKRADGSTAAITRQGNTYPAAFSDTLAVGVPSGSVVVGELEVFRDGLLLDRKTGNGILNSIMQDGEQDDPLITVRMTAWDLLTEAEFSQKKSSRKYSERFEKLVFTFLLDDAPTIKTVPTWKVTSLFAAMTIFLEHTSKGLEGCVAKSPDSLWKNGTATDIIKLKVMFEAEYLCTAIYEGEGKAKGMMGGITVQTSDGLLENNCGTGFSDAQRKEFWEHPERIVQKVVTLEANDIIQSRDTRKKPSLSLPVFAEVRTDKAVADTYAHVMAQLNAARGK